MRTGSAERTYDRRPRLPIPGRREMSGAQCRRRVGRVAFGLSVWLSFGLAFEAGAGSDSHIPSPLVAVGKAAVPGVTLLGLDRSLYESLKNRDSAVLHGFPLPDGPVDLSVEPFSGFAPGAKILIGDRESDSRPDHLMLRGSVIGAEESSVFLSISPRRTSGLIQSGDRHYVISSGPDSSRRPIVYELGALPEGAIEWSPFQCHADELPPLLPLAAGRSDDGGDEDAPCRAANVAIETDHEYLSHLFDGDQDAAIEYVLTLVGAVSEIYKRDLNVSFEVGFIRLWPDSDDPWEQPSVLHQFFEFIDYWEANMSHVRRNGAHYVSGRDLGGGVGQQPGLCIPGNNYALSSNLNGFFPYPLEDNHPNNWDVYVVAHEWGHNFGGLHTHQMDPPVDRCAGRKCISDGTIMSYCHLCSGGMRNVVLRFHERNIAENMLPYLDEAPCDMTWAADCGACEDMKKLMAHCSNGREGGTIRGKLKFHDSQYSGRLVEFTIGNADPFMVEISGKKARFEKCCYAGPHPVELTYPAHCFEPIEAFCPDE
jgi:hypothetical protein